MNSVYIKISQIPIDWIIEFQFFRNYNSFESRKYQPSWDVFEDNSFKKIDFEKIDQIRIVDPLYFFDYNILRPASGNDILCSGVLKNVKNRLVKKYDAYKESFLSNRSGEIWNFTFGREIELECSKGFLLMVQSELYHGNFNPENLIDYFLLYNIFNLPDLVVMPLRSGYNIQGSRLHGDLLFDDDEIVTELYLNAKRLSAFSVVDNQIKNFISPFFLNAYEKKNLNCFKVTNLNDNMFIDLDLRDLLLFSPSFHFFISNDYEIPFLDLKSLEVEIDIFLHFLEFNDPLPPGFEDEKKFEAVTSIKYLKPGFSHINEKDINNNFYQYLGDLSKLLWELGDKSSSLENIYFLSLKIRVPFFEIARFVSLYSERNLKAKHEKEDRDSLNYDNQCFDDDN
jgi:hypothetical protein